MLFVNFKEHLKHELFNRSQMDPEYSIRKMARELEFDASVMVKILNGKRKATPRTINDIGNKLGLQEFCIDHYVEAYNRSIAKRHFVQHDQENEDFENYVSNWLNVSILMLTYTKDFKPDYEWIANRLRSTVQEVEESVVLLKRMGALKIENGKWVNTKLARTTVGMQVTPEIQDAINETKHSMLEKSAEIMRDLDQEDFSNHVFTFAGSKHDKMAFYKKFEKFFQSVKKDSRKHQEEGEYEDVYCLNVSLFPVSK